MENSEFLKRLEDLAGRCERQGCVCATLFLTPAERYQAEHRPGRGGVRELFCGGDADCERTVCFFLPDWMEESDFSPEEHLCAIRLTARFGSPGHRDYMGALLGMGIGREWLGDIRVAGSEAVLFCLPSVKNHLLGIEKVGRCGVTAEEIPLSAVPAPLREVRKVSFSVMSPRLDAVVGGMFHLSRTEAARQITAGNVSVNYSVSDKTDFGVREGDIISLRGAGKGVFTGSGGTSKKGRLFVYAEIYK